ncbi:hypothetical protein HID58_037107, partial [Brassica napus]
RRGEDGERRIEIKKIENVNSRQVTFSKRRNGLMKRPESFLSSVTLSGVINGEFVFCLKCVKVWSKPFQDMDTVVPVVIKKDKQRQHFYSVLHKRTVLWYLPKDDAMKSEVERLQLAIQRLKGRSCVWLGV